MSSVDGVTCFPLKDCVLCSRKFGGTRWASGKSGPLNSHAQDILLKKSSKSEKVDKTLVHRLLILLLLNPYNLNLHRIIISSLSCQLFDVLGLVQWT